MRRTLITGAAGFVGYHLARHLLDEKTNHLSLVDNLQRGEMDDGLRDLIQDRRVTFRQLDLTDPRCVGELGEGFDDVYHLAAVNGTKWFYEAPDHVLHTNTLSLIHVLQWFVRSNRDGKLCFTSSNEGYAGALEAFGTLPIPTPESVPLVISDPFNPRWSYAATKILGELFVIHDAARHDFRAVIVRPHNLYGPRGGRDHVIPELLARIRDRIDPFPLYGPDVTRSFCYVTDAVEAMVALMETSSTDGQPVEIVHIGNDEEISMRELSELLFEITGWRPSSIDPQEPPQGSVLRRAPDVTKLRRLVGWRPRVPPEQGLKLTADWYAAHP